MKTDMMFSGPGAFPSTPVTTSTIARLCDAGVHEVEAAIATGALKVELVGHRGRYKINRSDLETWLRGRGPTTSPTTSPTGEKA